MQIYSKMLFNQPIKTIEAFNNEEFKKAFSLIEEYRKSHYLLGYIRYEAKEIFLNKEIQSKMPLLYFEVYESYKNYEPQTVSSKVQLKTFPLIDFDNYKDKIDKVRKHIALGDTYQVNYTYDFEVESKASPINLYEFLLQKQTTPYNVFLQNKYETILSFSPELFFTLENNIIRTKPMKGTVKRGLTQEEDEKNIEFLKNDIKNRAENIMIVDLLRNDLGKIAKTGSVNVKKLFEIETHKTLHQMTSEIEAELDENITLFEIFNAIFPCGSITGAPKINTMKIIDELETGKRNVYCGAIGLITPEKTVFSVPIRILQKQNNEKTYKYRVGGAIVWDSNALDEWEETLTKTKFLASNEIKLVETIKVENLEMTFKEAHFERMKNSAQELGFKFNDDLLKIKPQKDGMMRVLLSSNGEFEIQYLELKEILTNKITISETTIQSHQTLLRHKTTHRPWYEASFAKIKENLIYDEIFLNENGELTEGSRTNIVLDIDGQLFTPPLESGVLNGVYRQKMLNDNVCTEKKLNKEDLQKASKIYCINSVRGMKEVEL